MNTAECRTMFSLGTYSFGSISTFGKLDIFEPLSDERTCCFVFAGRDVSPGSKGTKIAFLADPQRVATSTCSKVTASAAAASPSRRGRSFLVFLFFNGGRVMSINVRRDSNRLLHKLLFSFVA